MPKAQPKKLPTISQGSLGPGVEAPIKYVAPDRHVDKGLPQAWTKVPLAPKGGRGMVQWNLYRFEFEEQWYLLRWLPWGYSIMNTKRKGKMCKRMEQIAATARGLKV